MGPGKNRNSEGIVLINVKRSRYETDVQKTKKRERERTSVTLICRHASKKSERKRKGKRLTDNLRELFG